MSPQVGWAVYVCAYVYVYAYAYVYIYIYIYLYICKCVYMYICRCVGMCMCAYVHFLERSIEVWKDLISPKKELATLDEKLPLVELLPAKRKKMSPDPTKKDARREEFGRRALAGGNMWASLSCLLTLLESFDKNNPEMGIDSVARQMLQKTVQQYWVNIVKQQATGGGCPTFRDTLIQPMEAALNQPTFLTQA